MFLSIPRCEPMIVTYGLSGLDTFECCDITFPTGSDPLLTIKFMLLLSSLVHGLLPLVSAGCIWAGWSWRRFWGKWKSDLIRLDSTYTSRYISVSRQMFFHSPLITSPTSIQTNSSCYMIYFFIYFLSRQNYMAAYTEESNSSCLFCWRFTLEYCSNTRNENGGALDKGWYERRQTWNAFGNWHTQNCLFGLAWAGEKSFCFLGWESRGVWRRLLSGNALLLV